MSSAWKRRLSTCNCRGLMEATLGEIVNLNRVKKRAERDRAAKQADANRVRFGRTKSERAIEKDRARRESDVLDQHRIDSKDAS